jgi:acyl-[acyl-carrier-protein]-phospholipid O-acyltransferase/long-chain-fatty-acid--[acyl-carrier-protein] ligase
MSLLPVLVKDVIGGAESVYTLALAAFVVGIATGSALAAGASHGRPNLAVVPIGAIGMAAAALALAALAYAGTPQTRPVGLLDVLGSLEGAALLLALVALSISGGLYVVPSFAVVQSWAPPDARARVVASVNVLNAAYMTGGGALLAVLQAVGTPVWMLLAAIGIATLVVHAVLVRSWVESATALETNAVNP